MKYIFADFEIHSKKILIGMTHLGHSRIQFQKCSLTITMWCMSCSFSFINSGSLTLTKTSLRNPQRTAECQNSTSLSYSYSFCELILLPLSSKLWPSCLIRSHIDLLHLQKQPDDTSTPETKRNSFPGSWN